VSPQRNQREVINEPNPKMVGMDNLLRSERVKARRGDLRAYWAAVGYASPSLPLASLSTSRQQNAFGRPRSDVPTLGWRTHIF